MSLDLEGVLLAHVPLGDDAEGIEQCSCGVIAIWRRDGDEVRYLPTHAEGPDLRWHAAHVAAVLREQIEGALAEAWDEGHEAGGQDEVGAYWGEDMGPDNPYRAAHLSDTERAGGAE